eukprot:COSAG04_NODE_8464_length_972_cov_0.762887_1_plen_177_part_00
MKLQLRGGSLGLAELTVPAEDDPLRRELDERGRVHVAVVGVEAAAEVHVVIAQVIHQVHDQVRLRRRGPPAAAVMARVQQQASRNGEGIEPRSPAQRREGGGGGGIVGQPVVVSVGSATRDRGQPCAVGLRFRAEARRIRESTVAASLEEIRSSETVGPFVCLRAGSHARPDTMRL